MVSLNENHICSEDNKDVLNHALQSQMTLKPAFNCNRSWIYRLKVQNGDEESEITYALRFKKPELAQGFESSFLSMVQSLEEAEKQAPAEEKPVEEAAPVVTESTANNESNMGTDEQPAAQTTEEVKS